MKLLASYHGIYDDDDFNRSRGQIAKLYERERAALPIEKGGMGLTNISLVSLTAFPCSFAASLRDLAKSFPNWITLGREGRLQRISENEYPSLKCRTTSLYLLFVGGTPLKTPWFLSRPLLRLGRTLPSLVVNATGAPARRRLTLLAIIW